MSSFLVAAAQEGNSSISPGTRSMEPPSSETAIQEHLIALKGKSWPDVSEGDGSNLRPDRILQGRRQSPQARPAIARIVDQELGWRALSDGNTRLLTLPSLSPRLSRLDETSSPSGDLSVPIQDEISTTPLAASSRADEVDQGAISTAAGFVLLAVIVGIGVALGVFFLVYYPQHRRQSSAGVGLDHDEDDSDDDDMSDSSDDEVFDVEEEDDGGLC